MVLLEQPAVASASGVVVGLAVAGLLFLPAMRHQKSDVMRSMAFSVLGIILSSVFGLGIIYAYSRFFPGGTAWFGVSTVVGFMVGLALYAVRVTRR